MAPRINKNKLKKVEYAVAALVVFVFLVVAGKYFFPYIEGDDALDTYTDNAKIAIYQYLHRHVECTSSQIKISLTDGELCRNIVATSTYSRIFDTYELHPDGKEIIYSFLDTGSTTLADENLNNIYTVDRSQPVTINSITWTEDPFKDEYWKFLFYSLRPTQSLLFSYEQTHEDKYKDKLIEIISSFVDTGMAKENVWADPHAVAFRTMVLINVWWKLRENHALSVELSNKILDALEIHGQYLLDNNHFESFQNHGVNEASALYLLASTFPDLPHADDWFTTAQQRLDDGIDLVIDNDGALLENSPYYHFYTLEKYWEIYKYMAKYKGNVNPDINEKIKSMVSYATYVLQPDRHVPLLGASIDQKISYSGIYKEIAATNPYFKYVLTGGAEGTTPPKQNVLFKDTGQAVFRSGWGSGEDFRNQTQLIFDVGPYRTHHSDLDALSFNLYSHGVTLLPDAGLYTYEPGPYRDYFHGTLSHNTVSVDGKDQNIGAPSIGQFEEGDGYTLQSASHDLYLGVHHERAIIMVGDSDFLIIDNLNSSTTHAYQQLFHLFPEANLTKKDPLTIVGSGTSTEQSITLTQLLTDGVTLTSAKGQQDPLNGFCSRTYGVLIPCYALSYKKMATSTQFITWAHIGPANKSTHVSFKDNTIDVQIKSKDYKFSVGQTNFKPAGIEVQKSSLPMMKTEPLVDLTNKDNFRLAPSNLDIFSFTDSHLLIEPKDDGVAAEINLNLNSILNLSTKNLAMDMKIKGIDYVDDFSIELSNDNWGSYVVNNLKNSYLNEWYEEWVNISLGKGLSRNAGGNWQLHGVTFDWSKIDGVRLKFSSKKGSLSTLEIASLGTVEEQKKPEIAFIFDDGYASIRPAVELMNRYDLKGNIAVIADRVDKDTSSNGYLNLGDLKHFQDDYGWNMVNHSQHHVDAVQNYFDTKSLDAFTTDLTNGANFLIKNNLNSAPNWYVYPHGATNDSIKKIVSNYYQFARVVAQSPESYPFGEPLAVKTLSSSGLDSESGSSLSSLSPDQIIKAIQDAEKYNLTLFITFHRIHTFDSDQPGYNYNDFKQVIDYMAQNNLTTATLNEIDQDFGIQESKWSITENVLPQLHITTVIKKSLFFMSWFK